MTTALLRKIQEQDQQALADRYNGEDRKQPRRVWCVEALKPELTEQEYEAARRAVRECILYFPGAKANMDRVDMAWSDAGMARQMDAGHALYGLRQGVAKRCSAIRKAAACAEWIVQLYTLQDIASAMGHWRRMGRERDRIPDTRTARPFVRLVLIGMAGYYADCDVGVESWRGRAA
jgi:hypothetical protein